jgi:hypothetical protein
MRILAFCLVLFSATAGFAETVKPLFEDCKAYPPKFSRSYASGRSEGRCLCVVKTMMSIGPFLTKDMKFCPGEAAPIVGIDVVNKYVKAHPEVLKADGPDGDLLVTLVTAFREEWPCK